MHHGVGYLDLADGRDFVCGITALNSLALEKNCFALSGASTVPALTAAVVRHLAQRLENIDEFKGGITPSGRVQMGLSVIRAIASYAGRPTKMLRNGTWSSQYCLTDSQVRVLAIPGDVPLRARRFSRIDVPDLELLPKEYPFLKTVEFTIGAQPGLGSLLVLFSAWMVRLRLIPSLMPFSKIMKRIGDVLAWGEPRGGMYVSVTGRDENGPLHREWILIAENDSGPNIPAMPVAALIKRMAKGWRPSPGARPCVSELELDDFEPLFRGLEIRTGQWETRGDELSIPVHRRVLGSAYYTLPKIIQEIHEVSAEKTLSGKAKVDGGTNLAAKALRKLFGFPEAGTEVPVEVTFIKRREKEIWRRNFNGKRMQSVQYPGKRRWARHLIERFGPFSFTLALVASCQDLKLLIRGWSILGIPLPLFLAPRADACERASNGRFEFDVEIGLPLVGKIVHYKGWLTENDGVTR